MRHLRLATPRGGSPRRLPRDPRSPLPGPGGNGHRLPKLVLELPPFLLVEVPHHPVVDEVDEAVEIEVERIDTLRSGPPIEVDPTRMGVGDQSRDLVVGRSATPCTRPWNTSTK